MLIKILSSPLTISAVNLLSINFTLKTLTFFDQELLSNRKYATSPQITHSKVKVGKDKKYIDKKSDFCMILFELNYWIF
jgi:hypothetical protein